MSLADAIGPLSTIGELSPVTYYDMRLANEDGGFKIPKTCKAGVALDLGQNFRLTVEEVDVPEPGKPKKP